MVTEPLYFDWNATTPPRAEVLEAMARARREAWGNPASVHRVGRQARLWVQRARETVAGALSVPPRNVLFTSGGTEANNLALHDCECLVTSRLEHPSITRVAEHLEALGRQVRWLQPTEEGRVETGELARALDALTGARITVALSAVNHETGVLNALPELVELCHRRGARVHVDAVQALGKLPIDTWLHGDSWALAAHKLRGPTGIGALALRCEAPRPLLLGGEQQRGLRAGTEDAALAAGFEAAVLAAQDGPARYAQLEPLRVRLEEALRRWAVCNGAGPRAPHVANLSFTGWNGPELVAALDLEGLCVSSGSACSAGTAEPSKVIAAMLGEQRARSALRISLGETTSEAEIDAALGLFERVLGRGTLESSSNA